VELRLLCRGECTQLFAVDDDSGTDGGGDIELMMMMMMKGKIEKESAAY